MSAWLPAAPEVSLAGVQVVWQASKDRFDYGGVFNTQNPVTMALLVSGGGKTETHKAKPRDWEKGALEGLPDDLPLEIEKSGKPKYGDEAWEVTFKIPSPPEAIKALHFLDADGQEIESKKTGSSSFGMPGKMTYKRTYDLTEKPAQARIEVEVYTDLEKVKVPVDVQTGK